MIRDQVALPDYATRQELSEYLQKSVHTLARWAVEGIGPRFIKLGQSVRYRRTDVQEWLDSLGNTP